VKWKTPRDFSNQRSQLQLAFSLYESKGVFAVLIGSGLSRTAEIPTGWEITLDLIRRVGLAQGVEEQADWAAWYRDKTGQEPNYSTQLEDLAASPEERRSIVAVASLISFDLTGRRACICCA
jgi:hypothetical protein